MTVKSIGRVMVQFILRRATIKDVPSLIKLCKETILEVYGQILPREMLDPWVEGDMVIETVNKQWQRMIVAERAGVVVGVAAALDNKIDLLWVHPAHHRNGIGGALLDLVEAGIGKSGHGIGVLECFCDNGRAVGFYLAKGWQPLRQEMDDEAGAMKMVMTKALVQPNSKRS